MLCFQIRLKYCILIGLFEKYFSYKSIFEIINKTFVINFDCIIPLLLMIIFINSYYSTV